MAVLTAQAIYKQYMLDGKNNLQEQPGAPTVIPADGSTHTATPGNTPGIHTMQSGSKPSGSNVGTQVLSEKTIQQATTTKANTTGVSDGLQSDSTKIVPKTGGNSLQNDTSAMAPVAGVYQHSVPTPATGATAADGMSQAPQHE